MAHGSPGGWVLFWMAWPEEKKRGPQEESDGGPLRRRYAPLAAV